MNRFDYTLNENWSNYSTKKWTTTTAEWVNLQWPLHHYDWGLPIVFHSGFGLRSHCRRRYHSHGVDSDFVSWRTWMYWWRWHYYWMAHLVRSDRIRFVMWPATLCSDWWLIKANWFSVTTIFLFVIIVVYEGGKKITTQAAHNSNKV